MVATDGAVAQAGAMRRARDLRDAADRDSAQTIASKLVSRTIKLTAKAGAEGRLYGSITAADVATAVKDQANIELDRKKLILPDRHQGSRRILSDRQAAQRRRVPVHDRGCEGLIRLHHDDCSVCTAPVVTAGAVLIHRKFTGLFPLLLTGNMGESRDVCLWLKIHVTGPDVETESRVPPHNLSAEESVLGRTAVVSRRCRCRRRNGPQRPRFLSPGAPTRL